ncbi:MAG: DsbA family protein [Rhodospirillaceae bacterium]|nr:DsbA family protein [Rhodospirillaceae bacterium]
MFGVTVREFGARCGLAATALLAASLAATGPAAAQTFDADDRAEIEQIVHDYLLDHPEVIVDAINVLQARQDEAARAAQQSALEERGDEIFRSPASPFMGEADGDVVLVEFFDYQCGYCARMLDDVFTLSDDDDALRVVFKELPILGPASTIASQVALASRLQDESVYVPLHNALMSYEGPLNEEVIFSIAGQFDLDLDRLRDDMDDPQVVGEIQANLRLADALGIRGTPAFAIGDHLIPGAVGLDMLRQLVDQQRSG